MTARLLIGDVFDRLAELPDNSVDLAMTSPPFLALRSYLPADHADKGRELGSEPTPAAFIDALLNVTAAVDRVLAPHGSLVVELGDTYSGSGGAGGDYRDGKLREGQPLFRQRHDVTWPLSKSLCGIPAAYQLSLAYGINVLTGEPSPAGQWRVRNVVAWVRPNPPVGALGDKFRPATSYLIIACRSAKRWFDLDAVRVPHKFPNQTRTLDRRFRTQQTGERDPSLLENGSHLNNPNGRPPYDWWHITTARYRGSHYAVFPPQLCERPILAMCPQRVCVTCGEPSRRLTAAFTLDSYRASDRPQTVRAVALADEHGLSDEHIAAIRAFGTSDVGKNAVTNNGAGKNTDRVKALATEAKAVLGGYFREFVQNATAERSTSWTDCGHGTWRPGVVLDPFAGTGTTLLVAEQHGRDAIGIDLDARNAVLAAERIPGLISYGTDRPAVA